MVTGFDDAEDLDTGAGTTGGRQLDNRKTFDLIPKDLKIQLPSGNICLCVLELLS